jgi:hypothetical protein
MSDTPIMDAVDAKCDELGVMDAICYAVYEGQKLEIKLNAANDRIKRLEEAGDVIKASLKRSLNPNEQGECKWLAELPMTDAEFAVFTTAFKAKEAKP